MWVEIRTHGVANRSGALPIDQGLMFIPRNDAATLNDAPLSFEPQTWCLRVFPGCHTAHSFCSPALRCPPHPTRACAPPSNERPRKHAAARTAAQVAVLKKHQKKGTPRPHADTCHAAMCSRRGGADVAALKALLAADEPGSLPKVRGRARAARGARLAGARGRRGGARASPTTQQPTSRPGGATARAPPQNKTCRVRAVPKVFWEVFSPVWPLKGPHVRARRRLGRARVRSGAEMMSSAIAAAPRAVPRISQATLPPRAKLCILRRVRMSGRGGEARRRGRRHTRHVSLRVSCTRFVFAPRLFDGHVKT